MGLSENLKNARKRIGQTQITVAKNVGISNTALSNYETGYRQPDLATLKQLAEYYHVTLDDLIDTEKGSRAILDMWALARSKRIAFRGRVYAMNDVRARALRRVLEEFFSKMDE